MGKPKQQNEIAASASAANQEGEAVMPRKGHAKQVPQKSSVVGRTREVALIGLTIALIALSAWVTVALGPIPFTLQMFAITFTILVLKPKDACLAIAGYIVLGAVGVPVFSGMRGGIGVLMGPTGGFLWGYLIAVPAAAFFLAAMRKLLGEKRVERMHEKAAGLHGQTGASLSKAAKVKRFCAAFIVEILAGLIFCAVAYVCGCLQYMVVGQVDLTTALFTAVIPFIPVDIAKVVAATLVASFVTPMRRVI